MALILALATLDGFENELREKAVNFTSHITVSTFGSSSIEYYPEKIDLLKKKTEENFNKFYQCNDCKKIYWKGSHFDNIEKIAINLKSI